MIGYAVFGTIIGSVLMLIVFLSGIVNIYIIFGTMMMITYSNGIVMPNIIANIVSIKPQLACLLYTSPSPRDS